MDLYNTPNSLRSAFACVAEGHIQPGLTKREYFTAVALQGLMSNSVHSSELLKNIKGWNDCHPSRWNDTSCIKAIEDEHYAILSKLAVTLADLTLSELENPTKI